MSSRFNDSLRFLYGSPHSQNFYAEFQRFPQRILSPVTVIMLLCICKGIRCVQNLSKSCPALFGAGRKGSTFHFYRCAAFGFPVRHHIPCFSEKAVCRPCDALTEGKTQRTEGLFYGLHRFRGRLCIPGGRKIVIGCTLIPQRFGRDKKFVLCHFGQHAARACRNNFPAPASNETIHKLRRSGRSQWGLTEAEFFAVIFYNINRVGLCDRLKTLCNCRARLGGKTNFMIVVAEGAASAVEVGRQIQEELGLDPRVTILGHIQRGGSPTAKDRVMATRMGYEAVHLLAAGKTNRVVCARGDSIVDVDINDGLAMHKTLNSEEYEVMEAMTGI